MAVADRLRREGMPVAVVVAGSVASLTLAGLQRSALSVMAAGLAALTVGVLAGVLGAVVVDTDLGPEGSPRLDAAAESRETAWLWLTGGALVVAVAAARLAPQAGALLVVGVAAALLAGTMAAVR